MVNGADALMHMFVCALVVAVQLVPSQAIASAAIRSSAQRRSAGVQPFAGGGPAAAYTSTATATYTPVVNSPGTGIPPPPVKPKLQDAVAAAAEGVLAEQGGASLLPTGLADRAAELAYGHLADILGGKAAAAAKPCAPAASAGIGGAVNSPSPSAAKPPRRGPPRPPPCAAAPRMLHKSDVQMAMAPFRPSGAVGEPIKVQAGGSAYKLDDGGWAFQYPNMAARIDVGGSTRIAWPEKALSVELDSHGISYHANDTVIHRDADGDLVFHQPTGTIHQKGDTIIYHWCDPNAIVYHTPSGLVYYDDEGMTFRGRGGIAFYARSGDLLYQGVGGITKQSPAGAVTHWTASGAIYLHDDGSMSYTPVGESTSLALEANALGPDPFPGPPLTEAEVLSLAHAAETSGQADAALAAAAASNQAAAAAAAAAAARPQMNNFAPAPAAAGGFR